MERLNAKDEETRLKILQLEKDNNDKTSFLESKHKDETAFLESKHKDEINLINQDKEVYNSFTKL